MLSVAEPWATIFLYLTALFYLLTLASGYVILGLVIDHYTKGKRKQ